MMHLGNRHVANLVNEADICVGEEGVRITYRPTDRVKVSYGR
jgi:urease accessory protein UreE